MNLEANQRPGGEQMSSEWELIEKAKAGDRDALGELVALCWQPLYRFITYKTGNVSEAGDLTQETFYRAFRALPQYQKTDARFSTWLGRIAQNLINDLWRKNGRSPVIDDLSLHQHNLSDGENPSEALVDKETRETLHSVLGEIPSEQRQVIELRILAGLPVKEVANAMEKTEAAIKMLQQRALKNLREKLLNRGVLAGK